MKQGTVSLQFAADRIAKASMSFRALYQSFTWEHLKAALRGQGKLDDAIAEYRRAIEIDPNYAFAHNNLGVALRGQGKLDDAIAEYRRAIEIDPNSERARRNLELALHGKDLVPQINDAGA